MGSRAALGDIQRLLTNLNRQLGSIGPEGGRQGNGHGKGASTGGNGDCPHCSEGMDNLASRTRCFKCGGNRPKDPPARQERPKQAPRARSRPAKPSAPAPAPTPHPKMDAMDVQDHQEDAASELATARSLHEWARKLPQPARDKEGQSPDLLKELAGSLGIPATQELAQEQQAAPTIPEGETMEASGPKKAPKQARIKSQGVYARPGEATTGAGTRSTSSHGAQEEGATERPTDRGTGADEAEQL